MKILDELTDIPMSRERKRQLRRNRAGLCAHGGCHSPPVLSGFCLRHYQDLREYQNRRRGTKRRYKNTKLGRMLKAV